MTFAGRVDSLPAMTTLVVLLALSRALAGPAPASTASLWPPIRFDDRKGVVVLQAPVFMPEIRAKGAKLGYVHPPSTYLGELNGRSDAAAAQWDSSAEFGMPLRIEPVDRAALTHDSKKCTLFCVYGMQTDVEGVELCKCRDPCREVLCSDGERCVPERSCSSDGCRYRGYCQAAATKMKTTAAGAAATLCALGKPKSSSSSSSSSSSAAWLQSSACLNATRRYYYDARTQRCRKFRGCDSDVSGSFVTHRQCSMACERTARVKALPSASPASAAAIASRPKFVALAVTATQASTPTETTTAATTRSRLHASGPAATPDQSGVGGLLLQVSRQQRYGGQPGLKPRVNSDHYDDRQHGDDDGCAPGEVPISHEICPYDPCERCSVPGVVCRPSRCGRCRAVYHNVRTGFTAVREGGGFC